MAVLLGSLSFLILLCTIIPKLYDRWRAWDAGPTMPKKSMPSTRAPVQKPKPKPKPVEKPPTLELPLEDFHFSVPEPDPIVEELPSDFDLFGPANPEEAKLEYVAPKREMPQLFFPR